MDVALCVSNFDNRVGLDGEGGGSRYENIRTHFPILSDSFKQLDILLSIILQTIKIIS